MTISEMSAQYADKQLEMVDPDLAATSYSRHTKMDIRVFCGSDVEEAYEDGASALLREVQEIISKQGNDYLILEELKSRMKQLKGE